MDSIFKSDFHFKFVEDATFVFGKSISVKNVSQNIAHVFFNDFIVIEITNIYKKVYRKEANHGQIHRWSRKQDEQVDVFIQEAEQHATDPKDIQKPVVMEQILMGKQESKNILTVDEFSENLHVHTD